jgi:cytochrome P450
MNASILVIAGSETTATLLSGATYFLLTHPPVLEKLVQEVRSSFDSEMEITLISVNKLTYMLAVLNEALRCYPPVVSNMVRVTSKGGETIAGQYIPGGVSTLCSLTYLSSCFVTRDKS